VVPDGGALAGVGDWDPVPTARRLTATMVRPPAVGQPREVAGLVEIACEEPMGGYAWDGDDRWTPYEVRGWWARREAIRAWIASELGGAQNAREALRRYATYLDDGLEDYLRGYLFWLTEKREPRRGKPLPAL